MTIIDFHTHAFPDELAPRAIAALEGEIDDQWKAKTDGTVAGLLGSMDDAGIDKAVICSIATKPGQFEPILAWCKAVRSERILPLASIHPDSEDPGRLIDRVAEAGLIGVKMHPMYQQYQADDFDRLGPIYDACAQAGLLLVSHCGCDIAYPGNDNADPARIAAVLDEYPRLNFVATHMGGWLSWPAVRKHLLGRDCWMETSFATLFMPPADLAELINAHGVDRVMFGSDSPWGHQGEELARIRKLPLPGEDIDAILGRNAEALLG